MKKQLNKKTNGIVLAAIEALEPRTLMSGGGYLLGDAGNDLLIGGTSNSELSGDDGVDTIFSQGAADIIFGNNWDVNDGSAHTVKDLARLADIYNNPPSRTFVIPAEADSIVLSGVVDRVAARQRDNGQPGANRVRVGKVKAKSADSFDSRLARGLLRVAEVVLILVIIGLLIAIWLPAWVGPHPGMGRQ